MPSRARPVLIAQTADRRDLVGEVGRPLLRDQPDLELPDRTRPWGRPGGVEARARLQLEDVLGRVQGPDARERRVEALTTISVHRCSVAGRVPTVSARADVCAQRRLARVFDRAWVPARSRCQHGLHLVGNAPRAQPNKRQSSDS